MELCVLVLGMHDMLPKQPYWLARACARSHNSLAELTTDLAVLLEGGGCCLCLRPRWAITCCSCRPRWLPTAWGDAESSCRQAGQPGTQSPSALQWQMSSQNHGSSRKSELGLMLSARGSQPS